MTIFRRIFLSCNAETLQVNPSVLCFGKFPLVNNFMDKKGEE